MKDPITFPFTLRPNDTVVVDVIPDFECTKGSDDSEGSVKERYPVDDSKVIVAHFSTISAFLSPARIPTDNLVRSSICEANLLRIGIV